MIKRRSTKVEPCRCSLCCSYVVDDDLEVYELVDDVLRAERVQLDLERDAWDGTPIAWRGAP